MSWTKTKTITVKPVTPGRKITKKTLQSLCDLKDWRVTVSAPN